MKKITLQAQNQFSVQNEEQLLSWLLDCVLLLDKQIGVIHIALMDDDALLDDVAMCGSMVLVLPQDGDDASLDSVGEGGVVLQPLHAVFV